MNRVFRNREFWLALGIAAMIAAIALWRAPSFATPANLADVFNNTAILMILALGLFRLGRVINFIPAPVITGFTSGIALIIAIGQIDNALGIHTEAEESAALKLVNYFRHPLPDINTYAVISTVIVAAIMFLLPRVPGLARVPTALIGIAGSLRVRS